MGKLYGWMRQSKAPAYIFTALMTLLYIGIVCLAAYTFGGIVDLSDETTQLLGYAIVFVSGAICFKELSDMFYEMRLACVLQKLRLNDPSAFKGISALKAATVGSAKAMGLSDSLYVKVGQRADLLLIDLNRPNMRPFNDLPNNLVYSGAKDDVKMTMVEGRPLYLDGRFNLPQSVDSIIAEAEEVTSRLKKEFESR